MPPYLKLLELAFSIEEVGRVTQFNTFFQNNPQLNDVSGFISLGLHKETNATTNKSFLKKILYFLAS